MKFLSLLLTLSLGLSCAVFAQTNYSAIASNRIIQKHHLPERIAKIAQIDPVRLQVLWKYFTESYTFTNETGLSIQELLNIHHFDVSEYESLRQSDAAVQFIFRGSIQITLKPGNELNTLLQGYELNSLITELPLRPFPQWTSSDFTESDFQNYKELVWDWAKDYPEAYLQITSNTNRLHIRFDEWKNLPDPRRAIILSEMNYLITD